MKHERITTDPQIMTGKPVIKNTRIPVEQVLRELASGWTFADILDSHPRLRSHLKSGKERIRLGV